MHVVVIGAGIAGLVAAHTTQRLNPTAKVTVLEAGDRVGGRIKTTRYEWGQIEHGAEMVVTKYPQVLELFEQLGLEVERPAPLEFMIKSDGELHRVPRGLLSNQQDEVAKSLAELSCLSAEGKVAAQTARNMWVPADVSDDLSLSDILQRNFGGELAEKIMEPLYGGIHGGRASELSSALYNPVPYRAEKSANGKAAPILTSVKGGMSRIIEKLTEGLDIQRSTAVYAIEKSGQDWIINTSKDVFRCKQIVFALPFDTTARLLHPFAPEFETLGITTMLRTAQGCHLVFDKSHQTPETSGYLIPYNQDRNVSAVSMLHKKWPDRISANHEVYRVFFRSDELLSDNQLEQCALSELRTTLGITASPTATKIDRWENGIAAFAPGHKSSAQAVLTALQKHPGLECLPSSLLGTGIADAIRDGVVLGGRIS